MTFMFPLFLAAGLIFFAAMTIAAFIWAAKTGGFRDFDVAARSIFDAGEPVGMTTDAFAVQSRKRTPLAAGRKAS